MHDGEAPHIEWVVYLFCAVVLSENDVVELCKRDSKQQIYVSGLAGICSCMCKQGLRDNLTE
jgi:hypothetical protein